MNCNDAPSLGQARSDSPRRPTTDLSRIVHKIPILQRTIDKGSLGIAESDWCRYKRRTHASVESRNVRSTSGRLERNGFPRCPHHCWKLGTITTDCNKKCRMAQVDYNDRIIIHFLT